MLKTENMNSLQPIIIRNYKNKVEQIITYQPIKT